MKACQKYSVELESIEGLDEYFLPPHVFLNKK